MHVDLLVTYSTFLGRWFAVQIICVGLCLSLISLSFWDSKRSSAFILYYYRFVYSKTCSVRRKITVVSD